MDLRLKDLILQKFFIKRFNKLLENTISNFSFIMTESNFFIASSWFNEYITANNLYPRPYFKFKLLKH